MKNILCDQSVINNEDTVEKFFMDRLIQKLGYKDKDIKPKHSIKQLTIGSGSKKENHKPDYVLLKDNKPIIVIDAKATYENVDDYIYQTSGYSLALNQTFKNENPVKYFILSNGITTRLYNWDENESILTLYFEDFEESNPKYLKLLELLSYKTIILKTG